MAEVAIGGVLGVCAKVIAFLLDLFRSQLEVYVDLKLFAAQPYEIVLINRSQHRVKIDRLQVVPDGFPSEANGWLISDRPFFKGRRLVTGQSVKILLKGADLGETTLRTFIVEYTTFFFGWEIARKKRLAECDFDITGMTISVSATLGSPKVGK
ncbi:hypothetical protein ACNI65_11400 [Roseateles sp. So40a]|uniref:hypothetical protein n=1 Tax=Roseateles sp. So40a TaxID=3400226 RepID=UPI003A8C3CA7